MYMKVDVIIDPLDDIDDFEMLQGEEEVYTKTIYIDPFRVESYEEDNVYTDCTLVRTFSGADHVVMMPLDLFVEYWEQTKKEDMWTKFYKDKGN